MVRVLIQMRGAVARHQWDRTGHAVAFIGLAVGLAFAGGTFVLGFAHHARPDADADIVAAVFVLWFGGQLAQAALTGGDNTLRPEMFALLPLPPRRLAWSLLVLGIVEPAVVRVLLAYAALIPLGAHAGAVAALIGVVAAVLLAALTATSSIIVGGMLGSGRGRDLGTVVTAIALSALAVAGTLLPTIVAALNTGRAGTLIDVVRFLPPGWAVNAVRDARASHFIPAGGWLAALAALTIFAAACYPQILRRRMSARPASGRVRRRRQPHPGRLSRSPTGAVCAKELKLWVRDPTRLTCLIIALVVGLGVAVVPHITSGTDVLMPLGGPLGIVIAGACACNLYGNDGTALWLTVMTPHSARPDVRGRQAALAMIVAPAATVETLALTVVSGEHGLWPWAVALSIALAGGAIGLSPVLSLIAPQPLDAGGNPTPGWSIKVQLALYTVAATALPATALLVLGAVNGSSATTWSAVPVAIATAAGFVWWGQRHATRRLPVVQTGMLNLLAAPSSS